MNLVVHTDGGARGNPGPAAIGVVIDGADGEKISEFGQIIGETTNNIAEYAAVVEALKKIKALRVNAETVTFVLDSTLVVNQLNGLFKVKDSHLREFLSRVRILEQEVGGTIIYTSVPREQNTRADFLVNRALDQR